MMICKFAKSTGKPCTDGYSKLIVCEKDNVIRCLKECMSNCVSYRPKEAPVPPPSPKAAGSAAVSQTSAPTASKPCGTCGGNGNAQRNYEGRNGQNISY